MFSINLNSIKTRVRLFFIFNIALVIFNYFYTAYYNAESEKDQRHVEVSRENEKKIEKLEYVAKAIVVAGESELKKVLEKDLKLYTDNLNALKEGGEAVISNEITNIEAPSKGRRELKSLEMSWLELRKQLQVIIDKKVEVDVEVDSTLASAQSSDDSPKLIAKKDSTKAQVKRDTSRRDSVEVAILPRVNEDIEEEKRDAISYYQDINPEVEKAYFLAQTYLDEVLNKNRELSDVYQANFNNSQVWLRSVLFLTFLLNLFVLIGGTFVIGTYLVNPLKQIAYSAKDVGQGDIGIEIKYDRKDEIGEVADSLNLIVGSFKQYTDFAENIGQGNFDSVFEVKSEKDTLGYALLRMRNNLKAIDEEDNKRNWTNEGFALFSNILRSSDQELDEFAYQIISNLVKYLEANQGGLFLLTEEAGKQYLELKATFAYNKRKYEEKKILVGQGLLGQAVLEKDIIYLDEVPGNYLQITSGLGKATPRSLLIAPLKVNEEVFGAIEIASFNFLDRYQIDFVERLAESIASTISTVKINENTKRLLEETRQYAEQMQAQEEEMRQNMEELATTQEEMERNQHKLEDYKRNLEREVENRTAQLKEKEGALANALSQLQGIMDSSRAGIVALDADYQVVSANKQMHEIIYHIRQTEFEIGDYWFNVFSHEADKSRAKSLWDRAFSGIYFTIEDSFLWDESRRWYEISFSPILNEDKIVIGASMFMRDITDRKKELKNIELTAHILDNSTNEVYVFDPQHFKYVMVNERARQNLGYTLEEVLQVGPLDVEMNLDKAEFVRKIEALRKNQADNLSYDTTHFRKDGSSYEVEASLQYFEDEETPLIALIAQDISERKQNESQLTEALERFDLATSATKEGLWEMDINPIDPLNSDNPAWWSKRFKAILGFDEPDFAPQLDSWSTRIHLEDRDMVMRAFYDHITDTSGKTPFNVEYRILHQNQTYIWVSAIGETLRDQDGTPRKVAGSIRDISRRKRAEQDLAEQTAIVNGILNAAVNSIISFDLEGKILSVNPATSKMFGYSPEEILGKPLNLLIANGKLDFDQMLDSITETEGRRKGNQLFPLEVSLSETNLSDKKIYVGILRDASQRRAQINELNEKAKD
ncbi:MAG: PAS domain S-box protein [Microscillaceae bacterium]|jgi:PAS domain S-box-containing protein|nr:PAS domain S-box protein [Microscillaceae bacterium]